jgi:hypothetical protein
MRPQFKWALLAMLCVSAMFFLPNASLSFAKQVLEIMVVLHLGLEVLRNMKQG